MAFIEFRAKGGKFIPQITINKSGGFGLSSGMHHKYGIDKYTGARLYYDQDQMKVGIKLMEKAEAGIFTLKKRPNEKGAFFSARSFFQSYSLDPAEYAGRYSPQEEEIDGIGRIFTVKISRKSK